MPAATFTESAARVVSMSVGLMKAAFDAALEFFKSETRCGKGPIIQHQSPTRIETSRYLCWKALHDLDTNGDPKLVYPTKISGSECAVQSVHDAMRVVGVSIYSVKMPFWGLLQDAGGLLLIVETWTFAGVNCRFCWRMQETIL